MALYCKCSVSWRHNVDFVTIFNPRRKETLVQCTVWGKIIQHVGEFSKFYISRLHKITKYGPHINNSMKGLNI